MCWRISLIAHKEARFLFPLAILATAFPVLGFSPRLPRWRETFERLWDWRRSLGGESRHRDFRCWRMAYFALYPFGVRPHMPMAQYLYRHWPGTVYSLDAPFQSYPIYRPAGFKSEKLTPAQLASAAGQGPGLSDDGQRRCRRRLPPGAQRDLALFGISAGALRLWPGRRGLYRGYTAFAARHRFLKLLPLYWYTLYRVERSATIRS